MTDKLLVKDLVKVFGRRSEDALDLLSNGWSRDDIYRKTQSTIAVQDANFSVREGEIFVVMGLSGSGKSTLIRMLNRLIEPTSGQLLLAGRDLTKMGEEIGRASWGERGWQEVENMG